MKSRENKSSIEKIKKELKSILKKSHLLKTDDSLSDCFIKILNSINLLQLIQNIFELEKKLYYIINTELSKIDKKITLKEQYKKINIHESLDLLKTINYTLVMNINLKKIDFDLLDPIKIILSSLSKEKYFNEETKKITALQKSADYHSINKNAHLFLDKIENAVLLTLLKGCMGGENGEKLIISLAKELASKNYQIFLKIREVPNRESIAAECIDKTSGSFKEDDHISTSCSPGQLGDKYRNAILFNRNTGSSSKLIIPVWFDKVKDQKKKANQGLYFEKSENIQLAIKKTLSGMIVFDKNGDPFYSPFHIKLLHELIHIQHFSMGIYALSLGLTSGTTKWAAIWTDNEEYFTIFESVEGLITESLLNHDLGLPSKISHVAAMPEEVLTGNMSTERINLFLEKPLDEISHHDHIEYFLSDIKSVEKNGEIQKQDNILINNISSISISAMTDTTLSIGSTNAQISPESSDTLIKKRPSNDMTFFTIPLHKEEEYIKKTNKKLN